MKKSRLTIYDLIVLVKDNKGNFVETKSSAYKRNKNTILPLNKLINEMEE